MYEDEDEDDDEDEEDEDDDEPLDPPVNMLKSAAVKSKRIVR